MKKNKCKTMGSIKSFEETIKWKSVKYYGGPKEEGEYITSDGEGHITKLHFKPYGTGKELVEDYMENHNVDIEWRDSFEELSAEEILGLWKRNEIWYDVYDEADEDGFHNKWYIIYRGADIPKYWLDTKLVGPIDSEIDTYEEIIEE